MTLIPASSQNRSFSDLILPLSSTVRLRTTRRSGLAAEPSGGLSWKGTRTGRQVSPVRSPRPSARAASPPYLIFPRAETPPHDNATRVTAHSHGCLPPLHRPIRFVCCARSLQTLAHCRPPPKHALVPRRFLLHLRDTPPNRLLSSTLPVGRTYVAKKDTRRLPHGSGVALASRVGCGRWDLLHVRV